MILCSFVSKKLIAHCSLLTTHSSQLLFHLHLQLGNDFAVEEVYDAVGIVGVALGVGYHDDGGAFFVELFEQVHHFHAVLGVEVTRRLVGKDNLGVGDDGTGNGDALLLSARELGRLVRAAPSEADIIKDAILRHCIYEGNQMIPQMAASLGYSVPTV